MKYIAKAHGDDLAQVGLMAADTQESLFYVIDDSLRMRNDDKRKAEASRRVEILINDRRQSLGLPDDEGELTDVSN